jgi:hypothetical protein
VCGSAIRAGVVAARGRSWDGSLAGELQSTKAKVRYGAERLCSGYKAGLATRRHRYSE